MTALRPQRVAFGLAVCALALTGCGGAAKVPDLPAEEVEEKVQTRSMADRIATAYGGPKIRVAVGDFSELEATRALFDELGWKGVAPMLTEQITTGLVETGRVAVLERSQLGTVVGNMETEKSGDMAKYFDQSTTVEKGRFLGAQAILVGQITQFEPNVSGGGGGVDFGSIAGLKYHQDKAVVGIDVRLVDQETGRVLHAAHAEASIMSHEAEGHLSYVGIGLESNAFARTPLGKATRKAGDKALKALVEGLQQMPWEGGIVDVKGPEKVFIDAGAELNLKKGDRFRIIHRGDAIQGPDGSVLGYDDAEGGYLELVLVQPKMSVAKVVEGETPKAGDRVRLPQ
jgi:curli biogenesis system outer membrane secretion channel CsgG